MYRTTGLWVAIVLAAAVILLGASMKLRGSEDTISIYNAATGRVEQVRRIDRTDAEWRKLLTPEQYRVTRQKGTEQPFSGSCALPPKGESGIYQCVGCGTDLFRYDSKFESGTGWPSFWEPVSGLNVRLVPDDSHGMHRVEVQCARCGAHLGHVFEDGPQPTGLRYCINSASLDFEDSN